MTDGALCKRAPRPVTVESLQPRDQRENFMADINESPRRPMGHRWRHCAAIVDSNSGMLLGSMGLA